MKQRDRLRPLSWVVDEREALLRRVYERAELPHGAAVWRGAREARRCDVRREHRRDGIAIAEPLFERAPEMNLVGIEKSRANPTATFAAYAACAACAALAALAAFAAF